MNSDHSLIQEFPSSRRKEGDPSRIEGHETQDEKRGDHGSTIQNSKLNITLR